MTGTKSFGFMLVADSVGTIVLPAVSYPYWDLGTRSFRVAKAPAANLPGGRRGGARRRAPSRRR